MDDLIEQSLPWPRLGDTAFGAADDWWLNSCVNFKPGNWEKYAWGYKEAADIIVQHAIENHGVIDVLIFPVAFLYRHYLELRLKIIIRIGEELHDRQYPPGWKLSHSVELLWSHGRKVLEEEWPNGSAEELDAVEACVKEFAALDAHSMAFRYPVDRDGVVFLQSQGHINIRQLAEVVGRTAALLDASSDVLGQQLDLKYEMMSDMGGY